MQKIYQGKKLSDSEVTYLLDLKSEDINLKLLEDFFAYKKDKKPRFDTKDYFILPKEKFNMESNINTQVGRYLFNLFILGTSFGKHLSYINEPLDIKQVRKLENKMANLYLNDIITVDEYKNFIDMMIWFSYSIAKFLNSSLTTDILISNDKVNKRKKELASQYENEIKNGDIETAVKIENELLDIAKQELKDIPDMQIYSAGAKGSFGNNYKNTSVMRGVIKSVADPSKHVISMSSLDDGIPPDELYAYADILTQGSYSRAVGTRTGGYENKKLSASFQNTILDEPNTDCGTNLYLNIVLTDDNYDLFKYRFILTTKGLIELNDQNKNSFINKSVKIRSPLYCKNDKICNKCAGNLFYKMGIKNVGLVTNQIGSTILNKSLKAFHDLTVKLKKIDIDDYID